MISIILPVYNEEELIRQNTLRIIREMKKRKKSYEIIIIEESSDRTPEIVDEMGKKYKIVRHFHFGRRLGKGRAVEYGIKKARGNWIIFMDIDLAVDLSALDTMISALEKYDVVVGSRYHRESKTRRTLLRLFLGRIYAVLSRRVLGLNVSDFQCGFKGFRNAAGKAVIKGTRTAGVFWDTEFLYQAKSKGYTICEIPVAWEEKKGRSTKIGIKTIFYMWSNLMCLFILSRLKKSVN